jgi:hypothetical protein
MFWATHGLWMLVVVRSLSISLCDDDDDDVVDDDDDKKNDPGLQPNAKCGQKGCSHAIHIIASR